MREANYNHNLLRDSAMRIEDTDSIAIGLHTNLLETYTFPLQKHQLENGCSRTMSELTQASRTIQNYFSTPEDKSGGCGRKRRRADDLSYKRKIQLKERKRWETATHYPIVKKIKKELTVITSKTQRRGSKLFQIERVHSLNSKSLNSNELTFTERAMIYDWLLQCCSWLKLSRTVFHLAITLIEKISFFTKPNAQLIATTSLYTQAVIDDSSSLPVEKFEELTRGFVTLKAICECQSMILKDQRWRLPRVSVIDEIFSILQKWDGFVLENPKLIIPLKSQKCMFLRGELHVQNYIQFMAIVDSLRVMSLINSGNCAAMVLSLLVVFVGLELGYSTLQSLPKIKFQDHPPYQIVKLFTKEKLSEVTIIPRVVQNSVRKMYRCISSVMGILIATTPAVIQQVQAVRSGASPKLEFLKQFYFEGMTSL